MDNQAGAASANKAIYDAEASRAYVEGAPHLCHPSLKNLYRELVVRVYGQAVKHTAVPRVLDLGAGEGSTTLPFLQLGAQVTAVDISQSQLDILRDRCKPYQDRLLVRCQDVDQILQSPTDFYDVIVATSFLHHIPDYLSLVRECTKRLTPSGQFFSFQDPLRYDSVGKLTHGFDTLAYFCWRIFRGDVVGGVQRRLRRARGVYLAECNEDNGEYHVVRNGVDQESILDLLKSEGFDPDLVCYFSTHSRLFQWIGEVMDLRNTFAVIAVKQAQV